MPSHVDPLERPSSNSSSGNGGGSYPVPPARPRKLLKHNTQLSAQSDVSRPRHSSAISRNPHEKLPSPGEIITGDPHAFPDTESVSGGRNHEERFHDLTSADLVIIIDMQQQLLDKLNTENRDLAVKSTQVEDKMSSVTDENRRLKAVLNTQMVQANIEYMLEHIDDKQSPKDAQMKSGYPATVKPVEEVLSARIGALQAELVAKDQENKRLATDISFLEEQLKEKLEKLNVLNEKIANKLETPSVTVLENLIDTLGLTVRKLKAREEELSEDILHLKENSAKLLADNSLLKHNIHRKESENTMLRLEYEGDLRSIQQNAREDQEKILKEMQRNLEHERLRQKDLSEQLQTVSKTLTEEQLRRETAEQQVAAMTKQTTTWDQLTAEGMRHLQFELAQLKLAASSAEDRYSAQSQHDELDRNHYMTRWKQSEERLKKLREQLHATETAWSAVGRENALLLEKLRETFERNIDRTKENVSDNANIHYDQLNDDRQINLLKRRVEEREKELKIIKENTATADNHLEILLHGQTDIIDKFKTECLSLTGKLENARQIHNEELMRISSFNKDVSDKYASAVDLNHRLVVECRRLQAMLVAQTQPTGDLQENNPV